MPFSKLESWNETHVTAREEYIPADDNSTLTRDTAHTLRCRLQEYVTDQTIRQALFIASSSLEASIDHWCLSPTTKKGRQTERALIRYFSRMASRPTPFGLFSGWSSGTIGSKTKIVLASRDNYKINYGLDFGYLETWTKNLDISESSHLLSNSTYFELGQIIKYTRRDGEEIDAPFASVRVLADHYLVTLLRAAANGVAFGELAAQLRSSHEGLVGTSDSEIADFIRNCVMEQLLLTSLTPQPTGASPMSGATSELERTYSMPERVTHLRDIQATLSSLEKLGLGIPIDAYSSLLTQMQTTGGGNNDRVPIRALLHKPAIEASLSAALAEELLTAVQFLSTVDACPVNPDRKLQHFRKRFVERFGSRWVPVLQAVDSDFGAGLEDDVHLSNSPLIRGLLKKSQDLRYNNKLTSFHLTLLGKLISGEREITLSLENCPINQPTETRLPDAFSLIGSLYCDSSRDKARPTVRIMHKGGTGPSGAALLGRFTEYDAELRAHVLEHIRQEEALMPDAIYAEIAFLPPGRAGNIAFRPSLRQYEIPCLSPSAVPIERQVALRDLFVTVYGDEIFLFDARRRKRIIPRLSSAHIFNLPKLPPIYRFLCYLQYEPSLRVPCLDWGPLASLPFLPRVRYKNVILAAARWNLTDEDMTQLSSASGVSSLYDACQRLRSRLKMPRWVALVEKDNLLSVDFDNPLSLDAAAQIIRRSERCCMEEILSGNQLSVRDGDNNLFQNEVVIPYVRCESRSPSPAIPEGLKGSLPTLYDPALSLRDFIPGSEWVYFKIYGDPTTLDEFVTQRMSEMISKIKAERDVTMWFFLRYNDPRDHLRLRFRSADEKSYSEIITVANDLLQRLVAHGYIWKVEMGTYEREVERYGGIETIEFAERVFEADSEAVLGMLAEDARSDDTVVERWHIAVLGIDRYMKDAGFDTETRVRLCKYMRTNLVSNLDLSSGSLEIIATRSRAYRRPLRHLLTSDLRFLRIRELLRERSEKIQHILNHLRERHNEGRLTVGYEAILCQFIHLFINRLFPDNQRLEEMVLYSILTTWYEAKLWLDRKGELNEGLILDTDLE